MPRDKPGLLTETAIQALADAFAEAISRGCAELSIAHLVIGLIRLRYPAVLLASEDLPAAVQIPWAAAHAEAARTAGAHRGIPALGPDIRLALSGAVRAAARVGATRVGPNHLYSGAVAARPAWLVEALENPAHGDSSRRVAVSTTVKSTTGTEAGPPDAHPVTGPGAGELIDQTELNMAVAAARDSMPVARARARRLRRRRNAERIVGVPDLSESSRVLLVRAGLEAVEWDDRDIGTRHLLLAMLAQEEAGPARVLTSVGINDGRVRTGITFTFGLGTDVDGALPRLSRLMRAMLWHAQRESLRLGAREVEPEHILLALLREERGAACGLIEQQGVRLERLRSLTLSYIARVQHRGEQKD